MQHFHRKCMHSVRQTVGQCASAYLDNNTSIRQPAPLLSSLLPLSIYLSLSYSLFTFFPLYLLSQSQSSLSSILYPLFCLSSLSSLTILSSASPLLINAHRKK